MELCSTESDGDLLCSEKFILTQFTLVGINYYDQKLVFLHRSLWKDILIQKSKVDVPASVTVERQLNSEREKKFNS